MKRLSIFFAALMMAASVQMAHATITYELNGGITNDYGWTSKGAMALSLQEDYNTAYSKTLTAVKLEDGKYYYHLGNNNENPIWVEENEAVGTVAGKAGFFQNATYNTAGYFNKLLHGEKWLWLADYIDQALVAGGKTAYGNNDANEGGWRQIIDAFFLCSPAGSVWSSFPGFEAAGKPDAFIPAWKHAFDNPTEPTAEVALNAPYKEGYTFDGWYATADFSGDKVTKINQSTSGTLYAKWVEQIPTLGEIFALADETTTKAKGVVTYINGVNVYIQDATGGMLLYMKDAPTFKVADEVVVAGKKVTYKGAPEVSGCTEVSATAATLPAAKTMLLGDIVADPLKYFAQLVHLEGLRIAKYDENGNAFVRDDKDTLQCYKMTPAQADFPVGKKVNLTAIVGYYNAPQFVGDVAGLVLVPGAPNDGQTYEPMKINDAQGVEQTYNLASDWLYSTNLGNYKAAKPDPISLGSRGMAVKDGIMYFPYHNAALDATEVKLVRVDAATGDMLDPLVPEMKEGALLLDGKICSGAFNDLKVDNAGNLVTLTLITSGGAFRIWSIDEKTGAMNTLVDLTSAPDSVVDPATGDTTLVGGMLKNIFPDAPAIRLDRIGVLGDVTKDAVLMSVTNGVEVYYWYIKDGKWDGESHQIICAAGEGVSFSTGPDIQPIEGDMFYVDGFNTNPMLFDYDGILIDGFTGEAAGMAPLHTGHNGIYEFELNGEYFMVCAYNNTVGAQPSSFCMYKCKDENRIFAEMTQMWVFPANGMGEASNGGRVATALVLSDNANQKADIYVYTGENGYGKYTFTSTVVPVVEGINELKANEAGVQKLIEHGNLVIIKNGVRYNAIGAAL